MISAGPSVRPLPLSNLLTQVLYAALGEDYPAATVPHHHDTVIFPGRRPFRYEIALSHLEMTGVELPLSLIDDTISDVVNLGLISKDSQGFWRITPAGYGMLYPGSPIPRKVTQMTPVLATPRAKAYMPAATAVKPPSALRRMWMEFLYELDRLFRL